LPITAFVSARILPSTAALPAACQAWPAWQQPQSSLAWLDATIAAALPPGAAPRLMLFERSTAPLAFVPLLVLANGTVQALATPYTCLYSLPANPALAAADWSAIGAALGRYLRGQAVVRFEALDADALGLAELLRGLRRTGFVPLRYAHFGNWFEPVAGLGWPGYLASRGGALRETVRRRLRTASKDGLRLTLATDEGDIPAALAAYRSVYGRSWKEPEPYAEFDAALLPRLAAAGWLRLGVLWHGAEPLAAQYWTVAGGVATVLKLAHDSAQKGRSPGTVLTALMIERLLGEGVRELDFGRGDDGYKQGWAGQRRQRIGVALVNLRRAGGLATLGRHAAGRAMATIRR